MEENGDSWSMGLKFVVLSMNTSTASGTGKTPYELVFGQPPRASHASIEQLAEQGLLDEEDLPDGILQEDQPVEDDDAEPAEPQHAQLQEDEPEPSTGQSVRRGREHLLLHDGNAVAKGSPVVNQKMLHGHTFNQTTHVVVEISSVIDEDFEPDELNPYEETLAVRQYVLWSRDSMIEDDLDEGPHKRVRLEARDQFLKTAQKQRHRHENNVQHIRKEFKEGDTVGIKIADVDRTNTDARILPCKVKGNSHIDFP